MLDIANNLIDDTVDASHCRHYPYFVADTYFAILAAITLECERLLCKPLFVSRIGEVFLGYRTVFVIEETCEVCLDVVMADEVALLVILKKMTDRIAILDYVFAFSEVFQQEFVSCWHVVEDDNVVAFYIYRFAL